MHFDLFETLLYGYAALMYLICGIFLLKWRTESEKKSVTTLAVICFAAAVIFVLLLILKQSGAFLRLFS